MRYLFRAFLCWLPLTAAGQRHFTAAQLDTLAVDRAYHCDAAFGKFQQFATSGEEKLQLVFLDYVVEGELLSVSGQLLEGGPAEIYTGTTTDATCDLLKAAETDAQGVFTVKVPPDPTLSLYFICEGFRDLEIKVRRLVR